EVAATVDCAADTVPAFTTTVAVCVMATELTVADTVLVSAVVELNVPVATPLAFVVPTGCANVLPVVGLAASVTVAPWIRLPLASVVPTGCVRVFPVVGVVASVTVAPWIGLPLASFAVTVIVELPLPAVIGDVAMTVDSAAETVPGFTATVAVCVTATPSIVADTVFDSATVELSVPVATPLAFVVALGCVSVLPVPVAAMTTVAPAMGLPNASRAVTVTVD